MQPVHCSLIELSLWKLPPWPAPLFFRAPKVTSRRPQTLPSAFGLLLHSSLACLKPFPAPLPHSCIVALPTSGGSLGREPLERAALQPYRTEPLEAATSAAPLFFRAPKVTSRRPQTLPSAFGLLLHRSLACLKPFPAPLAHSCIVALPTSGGSLGREPLERAARCTAAL